MLSKLTIFQLRLFDEFVAMHVEDINQVETLLNATISLALNIYSSLQTTFRVKTGRKWNTFWEMYEDVFENVNPTYTARSAANELFPVINLTDM